MFISMSSKNDAALIDIAVQPRSSKSEIVVRGDVIKVYLKSPPVDGKANEECVALFSKRLKIPKSFVVIEKGTSGKRKRLSIVGMTFEEIMKILSEGV